MQGKVTWTYRLVAANSGTGTISTIVRRITYDFLPSQSECLYRDSELGIRPGTWTISDSMGDSCKVTLAPALGDTSVVILPGNSDCSVVMSE